MAARPDDAPQRNWDSPNCKTRSFYRRIFLDGFWAWSLASHLVEILRRVGTRSAPHRLIQNKQSRCSVPWYICQSARRFRDSRSSTRLGLPAVESCGFTDFHGRGLTAFTVWSPDSVNDLGVPCTSVAEHHQYIYIGAVRDSCL